MGYCTRQCMLHMLLLILYYVYALHLSLSSLPSLGLKRQTQSYVMLSYSFLETRTISVNCSTCPNLSTCVPLNLESYLHYHLAGFRLKRQTQSYVMLSYSFLETRTISVSCSTCPNLSYVLRTSESRELSSLVLCLPITNCSQSMSFFFVLG